MEFEDWLDRHVGRFSGVQRLFEKDSTIAADWKRLLDGFSVEALLHATDQIMLMENQPFPENHLGKIRVFATTFQNREKLKNVVEFDELKNERVRCSLCRDRGVVEVYDPRKSYAAIRANAFDIDSHLRICVVACTCGQGDKHTRPKVNPNQCKPLIRFDSSVMSTVDAATTTEQADELADFVLNQWKPSNFHSEFAS